MIEDSKELKEAIDKLGDDDFINGANILYSKGVRNPLIKNLMLFEENLTKSSISKLTKEIQSIVMILNRLSLYDCCCFLKFLDLNFPGVSFFYAIETRDTKNPECLFFYSRLKFLNKNNVLSFCLSPMRKRLLSGLLDDENSAKIDDFLNNYKLTELQYNEIKEILLKSGCRSQIPDLSESEFIELLSIDLTPNPEED